MMELTPCRGPSQEISWGQANSYGFVSMKTGGSSGHVKGASAWDFFLFIYLFFFFFWRARVCRPLLRLCRPFMIFEGCLIFVTDFFNNPKSFVKLILFLSRLLIQVWNVLKKTWQIICHVFGVPFLKLVSDCTLCAFFLVFIQKGSLLIIASY